VTIKLRLSTASQEVPLGYFVDSTDGNTEEGALTIANTDIKLWKSGATTLANKNSGGATHISNGIYYAVLDATDTNTLGPMVIFVHIAGALTVRLECEVLPVLLYDATFSTAGTFLVWGVASSGTLLGTHTTTTVDLGTTAPTSDISGQTLVVNGMARVVSSFNTGTGVATIAALPFTPTDGMTWALFGTAPTSGLTTPPTAAEVATQVWDTVVDGATTARQSMRLHNALDGGKTSGLVSGVGTVNVRDVADSKNRVTAVVDANQNRTSMTLDLT
jgi:hypothetical protein